MDIYSYTFVGVNAIVNLNKLLWKGQCVNVQHDCCKTGVSWFCTELVEYILLVVHGEVRACRDQSRSDEDIAIELAESYVH